MSNTSYHAFGTTKDGNGSAKLRSVCLYLREPLALMSLLDGEHLVILRTLCSDVPYLPSARD